MIITKLNINNYKSIENMSLEFVKGKNIIVGQNNSGKSNIISAINLVIGEKYPSKKYEDNYYYQDSNSFTISLELSECNDLDSTYLENYTKNIGLDKLDFNLDYLKLSPDEVEQQGLALERPKWIVGTYLIDVIKNAKKMYITLHSVKGEDAIYTLSMDLEDGYLYKFKYFTQELLASFITSAIIPSERNIKNELAVNNYSWYGKLIKKVWQEMSDEDKENLNINNSSLSEVTNSIFKGLTNELGDSVKDAIPYNKLEFKLIQDTKTDYYKGIKILLDDGYYSLLDDKGSGIKSLIIIELFKLYCKKYHRFSSCLIVEEPEVFLHPQARSVLSKKIDQFLLDNNNQTIVTTHSEQFLSNFDIKQLTFINKEDNKSVKYKIIDSDFTERDFQKMNIITKTDNAEMYFANSVILVEGGEKYIIRKLIDLYKDELFLDYNNCSLIKVGGKSYFGIYKKMLEKLGKKVYIIGDYDNLKEEINEYLPQTLLEKLNTIKSVTGGLKAFSEYSTEQQEELEEIFKYLKDNNIYILHNGALEDYYNKQEIDRLRQENSLGKAKEVVSHYISTILTADNINNLLMIDNDFKDYVMDIINCISDNSNVITLNDDDIYDDLD